MEWLEYDIINNKIQFIEGRRRVEDRGDEGDDGGRRQ